ncbi:TPA: type IV secretion system protein [Campylobacter jejuni]|nr:type IV secretion system protein [Campylobacter jejuni]HED7840403.1 type IV secretion system protein [Campylobacter jejuni]
MEKTTIDNSWLDALQGTMQDALKPLFENIFNGIQGTLYNGVAYTIIGIWVMFWCLNLLKNGYPSREELFNAGKWVLTLCFIFGIFYSYDGYTTFLGWLMIPAQWLKSATAGLIGGNADSFGNQVTSAFNSLNDIMVQLWNTGWEHNYSRTTPNVFIGMATAFGLFAFWLYYIMTFFVLAGIACIIVSSTFFAMIILSLAPATIPLLFSKKTAPYFYSWLKIFISYSLFVPASFIILSICMIPIQKVQELGNIQQVYDNQFVNFFVPTLISLICIYLLKKIPNWVSQVMGVQGLDGGGSGGALDMAKSVGMAGASFGAGTLAKKMAGGSVGESLKHGIANAIPGSQSLRKMAGDLKGQNSQTNLIDTMQGLTDTITGATAKAG